MCLWKNLESEVLKGSEIQVWGPKCITQTPFHKSNKHFWAHQQSNSQILKFQLAFTHLIRH